MVYTETGIIAVGTWTINLKSFEIVVDRTGGESDVLWTINLKSFEILVIITN